jgi:hypothetical protein
MKHMMERLMADIGCNKAKIKTNNEKADYIRGTLVS